jgi:phosphatidylglycerol:prolipoprotein diacylglycerol transferase
MFHFLHTFHPQPILLDFGLVKIHWYGFLMILGGLAALFLILRRSRFYPFTRQPDHSSTRDTIWDIAFYWLVGSLVGARIYYVLYAWPYYKDNLLDIFKIWQGGLSIFGILLGGFVAVLFYCRVKKINFWPLADLIAPGLALAQAIGRVGNYFIQEIFGRPTGLPWGIPIDLINRPTGFQQFEFFHPVFLYESLGNLLLCLGLLLVANLIFKKKVQLPTGSIFLFYLISYFCLRFVLEFWRLDYAPLVFGVRWNMFVSFLMIIIATIIFLRSVYKYPRAERKKML